MLSQYGPNREGGQRLELKALVARVTRSCRPNILKGYAGVRQVNRSRKNLQSRVPVMYRKTDVGALTRSITHQIAK